MTKRFPVKGDPFVYKGRPTFVVTADEKCVLLDLGESMIDKYCGWPGSGDNSKLGLASDRFYWWIGLDEYQASAEPVKTGEVVDDTNPKDLIGVKKPRLSLVPPVSVLYEALALQNGAEKYGPYNWRDKKVQAMIYLDACKRHLDSWLDGEERAKDSGVHHLGHAKACLGILLDALETGNLIDNRPKPGKMSELIDQHTKERATKGTSK